MIIDLDSAIKEKDLRPKFNVELKSYHSGQMIFHIIGQNLKVANDTVNQLPAEQKEIKADELAFDRQGMQYFRHALISITETFRGNKAGLLQRPSLHQSSISGYLRPLFNMESGIDYWDALREMSSRPNPIPKDYMIFMPDPDSRHPSRDDIIRSLVPFKKAQHEALLAVWKDEITAVQITHGGMAQPGFVLQ